MRTTDAPSLRARLLVAAGALTAVSLHGSTLAGAKVEPETVCISPDAGGTCPGDEDALTRIYDLDPERCASSLATPGAEIVDGKCCYEVIYDCSGQVVGCSFSGRRLTLQARPLAAGKRLVSDWHDPALPGPDLTRLSREERGLAALHYARIGAAEHVSMAGFRQFAMDLKANGAPPELLAGAGRARLDELRHARLAFTLASAFAGAPIGPAAVAPPLSVPARRSLAELAAATAREGCTAETLSACLLAGALHRTADPAVALALGRMRMDEERHAALAWETLRWALSRDPTIAAAVRAEMDDAIEQLSTEGFAHTAGLERLGLPHPELAEACRATAISLVIAPCRDALFDRY